MALPAAAQQDTARVRLDSLVVSITRSQASAARAPLSVSTVGRSQVRDARATIGLDEALRTVPGLIVDNRQNFSLGSRVVMRGIGARAAFGVRGIRVLMDGIPLTMPDGQTNLNNLDLGSAGSIHVLRGPASALYGNAAGGVIAVESEPSPTQPSHEVRILTGDQGRDDLTRMARVQLRSAGAAGRLDYLVSASHLDAAGFRDHSRARQTLLNTRIGVSAGNTRVTALLNAIDAPVAQSPGTLPADSLARPAMAWPRNVATRSGEAVRHVQAGVRVQHTGTVRGDVAIHAIRRSLTNPLPFAFIELDRTAVGIRALVERSVRRGAASLSVTGGIDTEAQRDARVERENRGGSAFGPRRRDQVDRVGSVGPFAQASVARGAWTVLGGVRYDAIRFEVEDLRDVPDRVSGARTLHAPSGMAGVSLTGRHATLFGNVATAFQTPTTTELINAPPAPGMPCCPAGFNRELEPQRTLSTEAGVRAGAGEWTFEAVVYAMRVRDALVPFQLEGAEGREFFRNAARTRHRGMELAAGASVLPRVSVTGAYSFTDVRFLRHGIDAALDGNRVPGITPHRLHAALRWTPATAVLTLEATHAASQHVDDANSEQAAAWTVVDVRGQLGARVGGIAASPFVAVENVFDRHYFGSVTVNAAGRRFYEPAPGRALLLGVSLRTGAWAGR